MIYAHLLMDPVVALLVLVVLLVTVVPLVMGWFSRRKARHSETVKTVAKDPPTTRFLGTQLDLAILLIGLLLLLALVGWVRKTFFG